MSSLHIAGTDLFVTIGQPSNLHFLLPAFPLEDNDMEESHTCST